VTPFPTRCWGRVLMLWRPGSGSPVCAPMDTLGMLTMQFAPVRSTCLLMPTNLLPAATLKHVH
jgi:hypothetical protein